jgi:hypothetical protein
MVLFALYPQYYRSGISDDRSSRPLIVFRRFYVFSLLRRCRLAAQCRMLPGNRGRGLVS